MLLEELLTIPVFLNAQLIAGHNGLSRIVHAVRIIDAREPDVSFKQGDLLVADHSELQTSPHLLADLLKGTTLADCSGLALNGSPAEPDIDAELLREADRLNFPIIAVSAAQRTSPGDIYQQATNCILEYKHDELQHALTIQKEFSALIMRQSDAEEIIDRLAQLLSAPILLLNAKLEWKACSHQAEQLRLQPLSDELSTLLRARRIAAGTPIFQYALQAPLDGYSHLNLYPIFTHRHEGYLISLHGKQARSRLGELAIEQAANALSMAMTKKHAEQERYLRYKTEFFSTLLNGSSLPEGELYEQARQYGLTELYPLLPIAAMNDELSSPDKRSGMIDDNLQWSSRDAHYELLHTHFEKLSLPFVIFTKNDSIVILLHIGSLAWDEPAFARQLAELGEQLYMQSSFSVSFGVGKPASGLQELRSSYKEAVNALQAGYQMKSKRFVQTCHTKDINRLLLMIPIDERKQFYEETFKDLLKKERAEQNELMKTLYIFHKNHCQIIETAKQLFIHRNTVIYRLDKCEKLTGRKLKDPLESLRFRIAFALEPLLQANGLTE